MRRMQREKICAGLLTRTPDCLGEPLEQSFETIQLSRPVLCATLITSPCTAAPPPYSRAFAVQGHVQMCRQTGATTKRGVLHINAVQKQGNVEPTNAQMCPAQTSPTQQGRLVHPIQTILSQHFE